MSRRRLIRPGSLRQPDVAGPASRAWRWPRGHQGAGVGGWMVDAPESHPFWPWHLILGVHLRSQPGLPPPALSFPGASHEIAVLALNPGHYPPPVNGEAEPATLDPPDIVVQVMGLDDAQAGVLVQLLALAVCAGALIPDVDEAAPWIQAVAATSEHMRLGGHPDRVER